MWGARTSRYSVPITCQRTHGDNYALMTRAHTLYGAESGESTKYVF